MDIRPVQPFNYVPSNPNRPYNNEMVEAASSLVPYQFQEVFRTRTANANRDSTRSVSPDIAVQSMKRGGEAQWSSSDQRDR